jgi:HEAT repeat protein
MKTSVVVLAALALMLFASTMVAGEDQSTILSAAQYAGAEQNLLIGLQSDNQGLRESSAYMLGELGSGRAVIPLMGMLRSDDSESSRIVAALALTRIGDARGVYAVKRAASFDESVEVQKKCAFFVNEYAQPGAFHFAKAAAEGILEMAHK